MSQTPGAQDPTSRDSGSLHPDTEATLASISHAELYLIFGSDG
jgi:hypothetical protein